ncbi:hypothetical protein REMIM1_PA00170 (plasmid) [Rhizobium etli bv. mimosae str. Mim1]|nr:hypothetical protein REMIM1_PA00170 [Rhizobium etli bv. mimosae str. Mim1]
MAWIGTAFVLFAHCSIGSCVAIYRMGVFISQSAAIIACMLYYMKTTVENCLREDYSCAD